MKYLIALVALILCIWGGCSVAGHLINSIASQFQNHDVSLLVKYFLWIIGFTTIIGISFSIGAFVARIIIGDDKPRRKKFKNF